MAEFKKKNQNNFWHSLFILAILFLLVILSIYKISYFIKIEKETSAKKELSLNNLESFKERENILNKDIAKMETENGIEDIIRDKFQVVKKGEKMVVIVDNIEEVSRGVDIKKNHGFWNWIKSIFIN